MPFSFNPRSFGRYNPQQPLTGQNISRPTGGLAPPYNQPNGQNYGPNYNAFRPVPNPGGPQVSRQQMRKATLPRLEMTALSAVFLFITVIFLIMVEIGNTHDKVGLRDIWFIKLELVNLAPIPDSAPGLGYGIGHAIGMADFYTIGLWNYCQGMNGTGVTQCTAPSARYWFDPIQMFNDQLQTTYGNGTASLPNDMYDSLDEIRRCSHWMFGLFMAGACLSFILIPTVFAGIKSRWASFGLAVVTFLNVLCVWAATIIATVLFIILRNLFRDYEEVINIIPTLGNTMFAMMWVAAVFSLFTFIIQVWLSLFCRSERDVQLGKEVDAW